MGWIKTGTWVSEPYEKTRVCGTVRRDAGDDAAATTPEETRAMATTADDRFSTPRRARGVTGERDVKSPREDRGGVNGSSGKISDDGAAPMFATAGEDVGEDDDPFIAQLSQIAHEPLWVHVGGDGGGGGGPDARPPRAGENRQRPGARTHLR